MGTHTSALRRRLLGLLLFAVVIGFVAVTILQYNKAFTTKSRLYLVTDNAGNSLPEQADVKIRGVLVGTVGSVSPDGDSVRMKLDIDPDQMRNIPEGTSARLLPKTLFGERYVALDIPDGGGAQLAAGSTIYQDAGTEAAQVIDMLDSLLPILEAVPPQDLSVTLTAMSALVDGKGAEIGENLDRLGEIVSGVEERLPNVQADLRGLATFAETYSTAAPDLVDALDNLRTPNAMVVERSDDLRQLLLAAGGTTGLTADFMHETADDFIATARQARRPLQVFGDASPTFGCTFESFESVHQDAKQVVGWENPYPGIRVNLKFVNPKGRYLPNQDEPRLFDTRPSKCYEVTPPGVPFPIPDGSLNDGSYQPPTTNPGAAQRLYPPMPQFSTVPEVGTAGSQYERQALAQIYADATGVEPEAVPGWSTMIGAPALRGSEVEIG